MNNIYKLFLSLLSISLIFAIKVPYGGEVSIRLNEPASFSCSTSNYSNMIFCSLIYENLFYQKQDGTIFSNLFVNYFYQKQNKTLRLTLKRNLSFSNSDPVNGQHIKQSINSFLSKNLTVSKQLSRMIKGIQVDGNTINVVLHFDNPQIIAMFSAPELILVSADDKQKFSGIFYPSEWIKNRYMVLLPNKFYAGGRSYLDKLKVLFYDSFYPDLFLAEPGAFDNLDYREYPSGVYQNVYICFPHSGGSRNTKIALFTLLKQFVKASNLVDLNALTSDEESPVSINIRKTTSRRMRSILRYSDIKLYVISALNSIEKDLDGFLNSKGLRIETVYIDEDQLKNFLNSYSVKYLLIEKSFVQRMPMEDKIVRIVKEMSFNRFSEKYLKLMDELDEIKLLNNNEMLVNQVMKVIDNMLNDSFIFPIFQKKYSLIVNRKVGKIVIDNYGRPLMQRVRLLKPDK